MVSGGFEPVGGTAGRVRGEGIGAVVCDDHKGCPGMAGMAVVLRHGVSRLVSVDSMNPVQPR
ncbi:hypothetical protein GCM10010393_15130 [Streptomyces gobitricini]|uniref:Uncharacterized protein n=1 Tax=Streptomyces gobitricini TaxID=68211 RepID=A0ABN3LJF3_9ACTN